MLGGADVRVCGVEVVRMPSGRGGGRNVGDVNGLCYVLADEVFAEVIRAHLRKSHGQYGKAVLLLGVGGAQLLLSRCGEEVSVS